MLVIELVIERYQSYRYHNIRVIETCASKRRLYANFFKFYLAYLIKFNISSLQAAWVCLLEEGMVAGLRAQANYRPQGNVLWSLWLLECKLGSPSWSYINRGSHTHDLVCRENIHPSASSTQGRISKHPEGCCRYLHPHPSLPTHDADSATISLLYPRMTSSLHSSSELQK